MVSKNVPIQDAQVDGQSDIQGCEHGAAGPVNIERKGLSRWQSTR
jgi:hypothetical protein